MALQAIIADQPKPSIHGHFTKIGRTPSLNPDRLTTVTEIVENFLRCTH